MKRWIAALCLLLPLLVLPLGAASFPQADALLREAESYGADPSEGLAQGAAGILEAGLDQLGALLRRSLSSGVKLLAVALLCGAAEGAALDGGRKGLRAVDAAGALAVTALTAGDMSAMIGLGRETIARMDAYLEQSGYRNDLGADRLHHEIYLSDARRVPPEKWKTVIRHPIKKA